MEYKQFEVNSQVSLIKLSEEDLETMYDIADKYRKGMKIAKERCKEIFGINLKSIIAYGSTDDVSLSLLKSIIPKENYPLLPEFPGSYRCYSVKEPTVVMHESADSAWMCLIQSIGNPKYAIIFKTDNHEG